MSENQYKLDRDLKEAKALVEHLLPYVYEDQLYGSIGGVFGSRNLPALTIGALLMRLHRLHRLEKQMTDAQKTDLAEIEARNAQVYKEWSIHYIDKLVYEAKSRLDMMETYFKECEEDVRSCANNYGPEALRRTIVQDIIIGLHDYDQPSTEVERLAAKIDSSLHRFTRPSDFVWASELQDAYPAGVYWWLYARPPQAVSSKG